MLVAAHAAAQLVQVGQAVAVGLVDEDRVGVGNVQAALDDRRGQQQVEAVVDEIQHHPFQLVLGHLAVGDGRAGPRARSAAAAGRASRCRRRGCGRRRSARRGSVPAARRGGSARRRSGPRGFRPPGDLPAAFPGSRCRAAPTAPCAACAGMGVAVIVSTSTICRKAFSRSFTSTPNRCSSSMITSPRLWNCTSGWARRCVPMTMSTEPSSRRRMMSRLLLAAWRTATGRRSRRETRPSAAVNVPQVLLGQQRGGHEHRHLVAGVDRLERRPHRHLGLAVAHVAAQQAVHRPRLAHVALDRRRWWSAGRAFRGRGTRRRTPAAIRCRRER